MLSWLFPCRCLHMITAFGLWMNLSKKNMQVIIFTVAWLSPSGNDLIKIQSLLQDTSHMAQSVVPSMTGCCQKEKGNLQPFQFDNSNGHCHPFAVQRVEKPSTLVLYSCLQLYLKYCPNSIILNASNTFIYFEEHCYM